MLRNHKTRDRAWIRRGLRVERLEERAMLAGNVTASVRGNVLVVRGDVFDNQVGIANLGGGFYAVAGATDTTIRGGGGGSVSPDGVFITNRPIFSIDVDLGRGNDVLGIGQDPTAISNLPGDVDAALTDLLDLAGIEADLTAALATLPDPPPDDFNLRGSLTVRMGDGSDLVGVGGNFGTLAGSVVVNLGNGANNAFVMAASNVGGVVNVLGTNGKDEVFLDGVFTRAGIIVNSGAGNDDLHLNQLDTATLVVNSGNDGDHVQVSGDVRIAATILSGSGTDTVQLFDAEIGRSLLINTGADADGILMQGVNVFGVATIDAGAGHDNAAAVVDNDFGEGGVDLTDLFVQISLILRLGSGDDTLTANNVDVGGGFGGTALLDAGSGDDVVELADSDVGLLFTALMGLGDDTLTVNTSTARRILLDGGVRDTDELISDIDLGALPPGVFVTIRNFEIPPGVNT